MQLISGNNLREETEKGFPVLVVPKDGTLLNSPIEYVVESIFEKDPSRPRHIHNIYNIFVYITKNISRHSVIGSSNLALFGPEGTRPL